MPRPRREPYVFRRADRPGYYAYLDRINRHVSLGTDDEIEAQKRLVELLEHRRVASTPKRKASVAERFASCIEVAKTVNTPKTAYELELDLRRIEAWLRQRSIVDVSQITAEIVDEYKAERRSTRSRSRDAEKGVSAARVNRELTSWRRAMTTNKKNKEERERLDVLFERLREPRPLPHQAGLTRETLDDFLDAVVHPGYRALFRVALGTGMRDDEIRHMDESDIRPPWMVVTPKPGWTTKSYHARSIPITAETADAAREFLSYVGLSLNQRTIWDVIQQARADARIEQRFSMHDLRRSWASHMLAAGHSLQEISVWLGHRDVLTTMRYLRVVQTKAPKPSSLPW